MEARTSGTDLVTGGYDEEFREVADVFRRQIARTDGGASLAVYHRGKLVVDMWGGVRSLDGDPFTRDTLPMCFSTTKGVIATCAHVLADRGELDYDERVATYWPEFAQNGKGDITVRQVLSHSAGLHRFGTIIDHGSRILDWEHMTDALARAKPAYKPGTAVGLPRADVRLAGRRAGAADLRHTDREVPPEGDRGTARARRPLYRLPARAAASHSATANRCRHHSTGGRARSSGWRSTSCHWDCVPCAHRSTRIGCSTPPSPAVSRTSSGTLDSSMPPFPR